MAAKRKRKNPSHGQQNPGVLAVVGLVALAVIGIGVVAVATGVRTTKKKVKEALDDASKKAEEFQTERDKRQAQLQTMLDEYDLGTAQSVPGWGGSSSELSGDGYLYRIYQDDITRKNGTFHGIAAWIYPGTQGTVSMRSSPAKVMPDRDSRLADLGGKLEAELRLKKPAMA